jgi:hypothetical protein
MKTALALLALAIAATPAAASAPPYGARAAAPMDRLPSAACIKEGRILNRTLGEDGRSIYLQVHGIGTYKVMTKGACLQTANKYDSISILRTTTLADICRPADAHIRVGRRDCFLESLELLSPGEVAALPRGVRP